MSSPQSVEIQAIEWLRRAREAPTQYWSLATAEIERVDVAPHEMSVLHAVRARCAVQMFDTATALSEARAAFDLRDSIASESLRAEVHAVLIRSLIERGMIEEAKAATERASTETGGRHEWLFDLERCAGAYKAGDQSAAMRAVERSLAGIPPDRPEIRAKALNNRGVLRLYLGGFGESRADFEAARDLYLGIGHQLDAVDVTYNLAMALARLGDLPASLRAFDEAQQALLAAGEPIEFLVVARAEILTLAGLVEDVLDDLPIAIERLDAAGLATDAAEARLYLAVAQLAVGDRAAGQSADDAASGFATAGRAGWESIARDTAVQCRIQQGGPSSVAVDEVAGIAGGLDRSGMRSFAPPSWLRAADVAIAHGDWPQAIAFLANITARRSTLPERLLACEAQAKTAQLTGDEGAARRWAERGLRLVERNRAMFEATELRVKASGWGEPLAEILVTAAWDNGTPADLFTASERWRWTSGFDPTARPRADDELTELLVAYRSAGQVLADTELADADLQATSSVRDDAPAHPIDELRRRERAVADLIRRRSAQRSTRRRQLTPARLRSALDQRTMIELVTSRGDLAAIVIDARGIRRVDLGRALDHEQATRAVYRGLRTLAATAGTNSESLSHASIPRPLNHLRTHLIAALEWAIDSAAEGGFEELVIVPTGPLQLVPWQLLFDRPVCLAPSASAWIRAGEAMETPADERGDRGDRHIDSWPPTRIAAFAGPGLPGALDEIRRVAAAYLPRQVDQRVDATVADLLHAVDGAALVHVASHGRFRAANPLFSGLEMHDGPATAIEFERLDRAPQALVLSGCSTGAMQNLKGGEVLGLATSLLAAGAVTVIASSLPLSDEVAVGAFERLHRLIAGGSTAAQATHALVSTTDTATPAGLAIAAALVCFGRGDWRLPAQPSHDGAEPR